jgi:hypothetical protein
MILKERLKNPLVQQYILEIVLPLVGYLFFGWSIAVIMAFYFMDYLASEIARHRRHYKIKNHWNETSGLFFMAIAISVLVFAFTMLAAYAILMRESAISEVLHIVEIKEFALDEGWFLLPVVYLAAYMKDVMTFYAPRRYTKYNYKRTINYYIVEIFVQALLILGGLFSWFYFQIPEIPALLIFVVVKILFDQIIVRQLKAKSQ